MHAVLAIGAYPRRHFQNKLCLVVLLLMVQLALRNNRQYINVCLLAFPLTASSVPFVAKRALEETMQLLGRLLRLDQLLQLVVLLGKELPNEHNLRAEA